VVREANFKGPAFAARSVPVEVDGKKVVKGDLGEGERQATRAPWVKIPQRRQAKKPWGGVAQF